MRAARQLLCPNLEMSRVSMDSRGQSFTANHTNLLGTIRAHSLRNGENRKAEKQTDNKNKNHWNNYHWKIKATVVPSLSRPPTYFSGFSLTVNNWKKEESSKTKNQQGMQKAYFKATKFRFRRRISKYFHRRLPTVCKSVYNVHLEFCD